MIKSCLLVGLGLVSVQQVQGPTSLVEVGTQSTIIAQEASCYTTHAESEVE